MTNSCQHSTLRNLMSKRLKQVSLFFDAAHSMSSDVVDLHVWFFSAFWCSSGKHVKIPYAVSRDQFHHRLRFCCDSFFTWMFLRSFRHHFRTMGRTEMANVKQTQNDSVHHLWNFPWSVCLRVGSMYLIWILGSKLIRSNQTNLTRLCGFWKHVSMSGFFP